MKNRNVLGRGLGKLIPETQEELNGVTAVRPEEAADGVRELRLMEVEPNRDQPRKSFTEEPLEALAESIREHGVIQPIIVVKTPHGTYRIIAGERRWRAARLAGLNTIPAVVREYDEREQAEIALIENLQREDLNPMEEALGFQRLMEQFHFTQEEVSQRVGKSRAAVANTLRLLHLNGETRKLVEEKKISAGHAKALLALASEEDRLECAKAVIKNDLSVRQTEALVKNWGKSAKKVEKAKPDPNILATEKKLSEALGTKVSLKYRDGKGKMEISYFSDDQLNDILRKLL